MSDVDTTSEPSPELAATSADDRGADAGLASEVAELREQIAAMSETLDQVVPHLVASLKRNQALESIVERLDDAERKLAARQEAPIAAVLVRTINEVLRMKHLDRDTGLAVAHGVSSSLVKSGYDLVVPDVGSPFDPETSEISSTRADAEARPPSAGPLVVTSVPSVGLSCLGQLIVPAKVTVGSADDIDPGAPTITPLEPA